MRYYGVRIDGAPSPFPPLSGADLPGAQWCSVVDGMNDPGAQQVEFDLNEYKPSEGTSNCTVTIQNPTVAQVSEMANLVDRPVAVYGGMYQGLPLASSHMQRGLTGFLMSGKIIQCWGSWVGTEMSLSFAFTPGENKDETSGGAPRLGVAPTTGPGGSQGGNVPIQTRFARAGPRNLGRFGGPLAPTVTPRDFSLSLGSGFSSIAGITSFLFGGGGNLSNPINLVHNLMPNMPFADAIKQTLDTAFQGATSIIRVSPDLKLPSQDAGIYQSLQQYAVQLRQQSQAILGTDPYKGITVSTHGPSINVHDGTQGAIYVAEPIQPWDLIGQPTWVRPQVIQFTCVMRSDMHVGGEATLPPTGLVIIEAAAGYKYTSPKTGVLNFSSITGRIIHVRHVGNLRNPDGHAWATTVDMEVSNIGGASVAEQIAQLGFDTTGMVGGSPPPPPPASPAAPNPPGSPPGRMMRRVRRY